MQHGRPSLLSLPRMARENAGYLQRAAELIIASAKAPDFLNEFLGKVETDGKVSINIGLEQLVEVLDTKHYLNVFELGFSEKEIEDRYNKIEPYFMQLMAFLDHFPEARRGKYGLLNLGNMGSPWPGFGGGSFCIVLQNSMVQEMDRMEEIVCISKFSLAYFDRASMELSNEFFTDLSNYKMLPQLALVKHREEIEKMVGAWEKMLANASRFIEIIMFGEVATRSFEEIRCKESVWNSLEELENSPTGTLNDGKLQELLMWQNLKDGCKQLGIQVVRMK